MSERGQFDPDFLQLVEETSVRDLQSFHARYSDGSTPQTNSAFEAHQREKSRVSEMGQEILSPYATRVLGLARTIAGIAIQRRVHTDVRVVKYTQVRGPGWLTGSKYSSMTMMRAWRLIEPDCERLPDTKEHSYDSKTYFPDPITYAVTNILLSTDGKLAKHEFTTEVPGEVNESRLDVYAGYESGSITTFNDRNVYYDSPNPPQIHGETVSDPELLYEVMVSRQNSGSWGFYDVERQLAEFVAKHRLDQNA